MMVIRLKTKKYPRVVPRMFQGKLAAGCLDPEKHRFYSLKTARRVAAYWGHEIYPCGTHYHLTSECIGAQREDGN